MAENKRQWDRGEEGSRGERQSSKTVWLLGCVDSGLAYFSRLASNFIYFNCIESLYMLQMFLFYDSLKVTLEKRWSQRVFSSSFNIIFVKVTLSLFSFVFIFARLHCTSGCQLPEIINVILFLGAHNQLLDVAVSLNATHFFFFKAKSARGNKLLNMLMDRLS